MKSKETINNPIIPNGEMNLVRSDERRKLEDIFHRLAEGGKKPIYGERDHAKFEGWFYRIEYDFWRETPDSPENVEILSFDGDEEFGFRHGSELQDSWKLMFNYHIRRAYFEESMNFLRSLDLDIARTLIDRDLWSQADEKNTVVSTSISIPNFNEIYQFIKEHIDYTIKKH